MTNNNHNHPVPFPNAAGVPVIGQPFTVVAVKIPIDAQLTCNCGGSDTAVTILGSVPAQCKSCGTLYNVQINPQGLPLQVTMTQPEVKVIQ